MYSNIISFFFIEVKPTLDKCNVKMFRTNTGFLYFLTLTFIQTSDHVYQIFPF